MAAFTPIPLTPVPLVFDLGILPDASPGNPDFDAIVRWPFADAYVTRLLEDDVRQRVWLNRCRIWIYYDPDHRQVGFGTLDVCEDYREFAAGRPHPYIPLLAVNPNIESLGFGTTIVRHLIAEAALLACQPGLCHDVLFLDVYTTNTKAINVYKKCGFESVTDLPVADPQEGGKEYIVMAQRVSVA